MGQRQEPNAGSCTSAGCEQWQVLPLVAGSDVMMRLRMIMQIMLNMTKMMMMAMVMIMLIMGMMMG